MQLCDIATREVVTVERNTSLSACAARMREHHVGTVVVVERAEGRVRPVGIVTDRDIVVEAVAQALDPSALSAGEIMAAPIGTVAPSDDVVDALARMRERGARRLAVVREDGGLDGIVALDDIVSALVQQLGAAAEVADVARTKESSTRPPR